MAGIKTVRLFADAIEEIIDPDTGRVVGIVYEWNTGERRKQWIGAKLKKFKLRPINDHQSNRTGRSNFKAIEKCS